jgi:hypothetical protein
MHTTQILLLMFYLCTLLKNLLSYINCTKVFHCDIYTRTYNVLLSSSPPLLLFLIPPPSF